MFTYTEIEASELKALDLLREYGNSDEHAVIARVTIDDKPEAAEVLFFPMIQRAGIAWGADAQWTDALTLEEAIYRFLNDEMVN